MKLAKVIAEMSGNHNGSLENALKIVREVAATGAHYLKIQTYTADTITLPVSGGLFEVSAGHELWGSKTLYDLYTEAHTPWEWHKPIFDLCRKLGVVPFSTPFDETAVEFLEKLDVPLYKIASLEIVDTPLIRLVANTGKPMIISTGTATLGEIEDAVVAARLGGCNELTLMLCTSSYPAKPIDTHLARIRTLQEMFDVEVGLSDHTMGINVAIGAIALGATLIEKHVTLDRNDGGVDSAFSLEPHELAALVIAAEEVSEAIGNSHTWQKSAESESLRHRPSIYITDSVSTNQTITLANIRTVRPSGGLEPKYLDQVLGRKYSKEAKMGTPLTWDMILPSESN
jgi:N-acetylneuraminate synthase